MRRSDELKHLLRQQPFRPFRVHLRNGKVLDVVCPEITLIGEDMAVIGITDPKNPDPYSDDFELVLMNEIQQVETAATPNETVYREEQHLCGEAFIMKHSEEMRRLLRQRPFQPFRVHLSDGRVYDVVCPEITLVGENFVVIGITDPKKPDRWSDDWELVDMVNVQRVEPGPSTNTSAAS